MALTKVSYSMITGAPVNVLDYARVRGLPQYLHFSLDSCDVNVSGWDRHTLHSDFFSIRDGSCVEDFAELAYA